MVHIRSLRIVTVWIVASVILGLEGSAGAAQTIVLTSGNSIYSNEHHCPIPPETLTTYRLTAEFAVFGFSTTFNNEDYPWPPEDGGISSPQQDALLDHGAAFQVAAELYPLGFTTGRLKNYFKPFIGAGLHKSSDGDARAGTAGGLDTYGVEGTADPMFTFGAKFTLPLSGRFGLRAEGRLTGILAGDYDQVTPGGSTITVNDDVQTWSEWNIGFTVRAR
jgi:hypothetical protein